ncbi:T9SS type A sorting domain-containing protein [Lacinutrix iliipiscaria]|uniref:T9SS type A sorting domain-containing protein n=1 Tax=Lacinutrix iliipiscaria TaxID=1230532 RepID=A0ABW5WP67_9FLAO
MFKRLLLIIVLCFSNSLFAQTEDVITGLSHPLGIAFDDEDMYICEHAPGPNAGILSRVDLLVTPLVKEDLVTELFYPRAIYLHGNDLYYAITTSLNKIDITSSSPSPEVVVTGLNFPRSLVLVGDYLYMAEADRIRKINIQDASPTPIDVITGLPDDPLSMALRGDEMFFASANKVSKFSLLDASPVVEYVVTGFESNIYSLVFYGDTLIVGMALIRKMMTIDMNATVLVAEEFLSSMSGQPMHLVIHNNELYIAGGINSKVFKLSDLSSLSIEDSQPFIVQQVYPNPTKNLIQISGLKEQTAYEVYNTNGLVVLKGNLMPNETVSLSALSSGMYFFRLHNRSLNELTLKVMKD